MDSPISRAEPSSRTPASQRWRSLSGSAAMSAMVRSATRTLRACWFSRDPLQAGQVARDYSLGWDRSIAEIFAEDFAVLNGSTRRWRMQVPAPGTDVLAALRTDLAGAPSPATPVPASATPSAQPAAPAATGAPAAPPAGAPAATRTATEVRGRGRLAPGRRAALPFTVPGLGNGIVVGIRLAGRNHGVSARADIRCDGKRLGGKAGRITRPISFRVSGPGHANCMLVVSRASAPVGFSATIRVTPPSSP